MNTHRPIEESKRILEERLVMELTWSCVSVGGCILLVKMRVLLVLQAKAQQQRDRIQEEKTYHSRMVTEKVLPPLLHTHMRKALLLTHNFLRSERPERVVMLAHGSVVKQWKADCSEQKC